MRTNLLNRISKLSRSNLCRAMLCGVLCGFLGTVEVTAGERRSGFRAGAYAMDITPEKFPISSNGQLTDRQVTAVHDPLHARCLVLDDGRTKIAIVICDSCMIPRKVFDDAKRLAALKAEIPTSRMLMAATHTHTAVTVGGVFQSEPDLDYQKFLVERIAEGIAKANANLQPARLGVGVGNDPTQVFNRRWLLKDGKFGEDPFGNSTDRAKMNPGNHPDKTKPAGPIDPQIGLLSLQTPSGQPLAVLANYSLHYVGGVGGNVLSADYFGEFANRIARRLDATKVDPPFVGIMSNGTSGDINNVNYALKTRPRREPFEQISIVAESVAENAHKALREMKYEENPTITMMEKEIVLGVRRPSEKDVARAKELLAAAGDGPYKTLPEVYARETLLMTKYPATVTVKLQAIRIGSLGIAAIPCETFVETGLAIKKHSPMKPTFTIELANGYNGYLPTPEQHALGGYETWRARSSYLAVDAEPKIRETVLQLLQRVKSEVDP